MSANTQNKQNVKAKKKEKANDDLTITEAVVQSEGAFDDNLQDFDILLNASKTAGSAEALNSDLAPFSIGVAQRAKI